MMHQTRLLRFMLGWLLPVLFVALTLWMLSPVAAQTLPTATAGVPSPTTTATPTNVEFVGAGDEVGWLTEAWQRFGLWGTLGMLILAVAVWFAFALTRKTGEGLADFFYRVFLGRRLDTRAEEIEQKEKEQKAEREQHTAQQSGLDAYLDWLQEECGALPQKPLDEDDEELRLEQVYVPLRVVERDQMERFVAYRMRDFSDAEEQAIREAAFEGLAQSQGVFRLLSDRDCLPPPAEVPRRSRRDLHVETPAPEPTLTERLLLVGEAGSGKTTTLHFGALMLARDYQNATSGKAHAELDLHTPVRLLPVYIKLTLLTRYLLEKYHADRSRLTHRPADLVYEWLETDLPRQREEVPKGLIVEQLKKGNCLVLFDGLDETGDAAERDFVKGLISNLVQACPHNRYIVTSRPFEGVALGLSGFLERHVSPMDNKEIRRLLERWFQAVGHSPRRRQRRSVAQEFDELWERLQTSPRLFDMATNPLLLTSMAILVHGGDALPVERARVYYRLLQLTIIRWRDAELRRGLPPTEPDRSVQIYAEDTDYDVRLRLQVLAAWMLEQQRREILLREVQDQLEPVYRENRDWKPERCQNHIRLLMRSLSLHSGLIQERDERYSFIHFTLQEYLAARHYDEVGDISGLLARRNQPRWRETILLAVGYWATDGLRQRAKEALTTLLDSDDPDDLLLAAEALDEANAQRAVELGAIVTRATTRLRALAFDPAHCPDPVTRNQAATLLDRLGADARPELDLADERYWAERIEPGPFEMGDDNSKYDDEKPAFTCHIRQPYALARYPVTNRQYAQFLATLDDDEAEHRRPRYWPGRRYHAGEGNHPVVGVSWEDACAFAAWVNDHFLTAEQRARGEQIHLPTEPEWERAAAYSVTLPDAPPRSPFWG